ncbi:MAG: WecB/TagA/CpsF family glycosyltransferase [Candidatus Peribacteria bacterium]|nr:MAG: WecB/TagA/CpsF family glycosyltransferase [Candidatus Peribacteria bacterium]
MSSLVLDHLYDGDRALFATELLDRYEEKQSVIVNFLYFANATHYRLFEKHRNAKELAYKQALLAGDFLLADGIALQVYKRTSDLNRVDNLNGTDLTPRLLDYLTQIYSVSLYVYSAYDEGIDKDTTRLEKGLDGLLRDFPGLRIASSYQSPYSERGTDFPFEQFERAVAKDDANIKLFLNCTGTPFQEVRVEAHRERFASQNMMVLNV